MDGTYDRSLSVTFEYLLAGEYIQMWDGEWRQEVAECGQRIYRLVSVGVKEDIKDIEKDKLALPDLGGENL